MAHSRGQRRTGASTLQVRETMRETSSLNSRGRWVFTSAGLRIQPISALARGQSQDWTLEPITSEQMAHIATYLEMKQLVDIL